MRMELKPKMNKLKELRIGMTFANLDELCEFVGLPNTERRNVEDEQREKIFFGTACIFFSPCLTTFSHGTCFCSYKE